MRRKILWCLKVLLSGMLAFVIVSAFCTLYYNLPAHNDAPGGATDYAWQEHKFYSRGNEGFAWGKTNNEGYVNTYDYTEDTEVDILMMGSSHAEAFNVAMEESTAAVLGKMLPEETVYNIGISGHNFMPCVDNMAAAVEKYKPSKYVVLEISVLRYSDADVRMAMDGTYPEQAVQHGGIVGLLQKNPFCRLLYSQLQNFADNDEVEGEDTSVPSYGNRELYDELMSQLRATVGKYGAELIIVYHPHLLLAENNEVVFEEQAEDRFFYADVCKKNDVTFLDMTDIFVQNYREKHILPHGFSNTSVGSGHLNKYGHAMIAEAVYDRVKEGD